MRIKYLLTLLVAGGLASAAIANPYETTLKNGLRVIVKEEIGRASCRERVFSSV